MALNDILKGMPSMDFDIKDYAMPQEFDFMNLNQNNRVLAVPPYNNVSFYAILFHDLTIFLSTASRESRQVAGDQR
jgi:hypothetical protein